jgi:hypothetical protein
VFLVATEGNPSFSPAWAVWAWIPLIEGWVTTSLEVPPQADNAPKEAAVRASVAVHRRGLAVDNLVLLIHPEVIEDAANGRRSS